MNVLSKCTYPNPEYRFSGLRAHVERTLKMCPEIKEVKPVQTSKDFIYPEFKSHSFQEHQL